MKTAVEHLTDAITTFAVQATGFASSTMEEADKLRATDAAAADRLAGASRGLTQAADQARAALSTIPGG